MKKLTLFIERNNKSTSPQALEYVADPPGEDGTIAGRFPNLGNRTLESFVPFSLEGKVYTFLGGKRYKVTDLNEEGDFVLVPDSI
jgi:hypothetical protein